MTDSSLVTRGSNAWSYIGVGCFTLPIGFFGGGMIAVLIDKVVGGVSGCVVPKDFPSCHTFEFLVPGALIGMLVLPTAAILRVRKGRRSATTVQDSEQGGVGGAS